MIGDFSRYNRRSVRVLHTGIFPGKKRRTLVHRFSVRQYLRRHSSPRLVRLDDDGAVFRGFAGTFLLRPPPLRDDPRLLEASQKVFRSPSAALPAVAARHDSASDL